jgi:hypothetical protein
MLKLTKKCFEKSYLTLDVSSLACAIILKFYTVKYSSSFVSNTF